MLKGKIKWPLVLAVIPVLVCLYLLPGQALAKKKPATPQAQHTINYYEAHQANHLDVPVRQLELGLSKGPVHYSLKDSRKPNQLVVVLPNTVPGDILNKIPLEGKLAKDLTIRKRKKTTEITINFTKPLSECHYRVRTAPPDRHGGKPYRLIIQYAAEPFVDDDYYVDGLKGRTIVIDAGHGGTDTGAHGPRGSLEKDITLKVAERVKLILQESGSSVLMTREEDVDVWGPTATDAQELQARVDVGTYNPRTEAFVSIHCNAHADGSANGTETYYYSGKSWLDELLATNIQARLLEHGELRDRGVKSARFYVLRHSAMPAALVEMAFISNYNEELLLSDEDFQQGMARAICEGLANYFSVLPDNKGRRR